MKLGIAISAIFVLLLTAVVVVKIIPRVDEPTHATAPHKLRMVTLDEFPKLYQPANPNDDAMKHYSAAVDYFNRNRDDLQRTQPSDKNADVLAGHLVAAMNAGKIKGGFLDKTTTIAVGMGQNSSELSSVSAALLKVLESRAKSKQFTDRDAQTAMALFALGERAFRQNTLLSSRQFGLSLMSDGGGYVIYQALEKNSRVPDNLSRASEAINKIFDAWAPKLMVVMSTDPHVGDLLNVAKNDQDMSFRIAATQRLGIAKFTDGGRGNRAAIQAYLTQTRNDPNPLLAEAARVADELTLEQFRTIR